MALAIRLSRGGRKNKPFYRIVVADKRMPRDGRYIEKLGTYNPLLANDDENRVQLTEDRIKYWLSQGAKPSERVALFLGKAGLMDMPKQSVRPKKSEPSEKTKLKISDKEEKLKAAAEAKKAAEEEAKAAAEAAAQAEAEKPVEEAAAPEAPAEAETPDQSTPPQNESATKTEEAAKEAAAAEDKAEEKAEEASAEEEKKED